MNARFEEMPSWQSSMDYAQEIFMFAAHESFNSKYSLASKLQEYALGVVNSMAVGRPKSAWAYFTQVKSMLYFAERFPDVTASCRAELDRIIMKSNELARLISDAIADQEVSKPKYSRRASFAPSSPTQTQYFPDETEDGPRCPKCGAPMKLRHGRNGNTFWGCTNYPNCNGILNVQRQAA